MASPTVDPFNFAANTVKFVISETHVEGGYWTLLLAATYLLDRVVNWFTTSTLHVDFGDNEFLQYIGTQSYPIKPILLHTRSPPVSTSFHTWHYYHDLTLFNLAKGNNVAYRINLQIGPSPNCKITCRRICRRNSKIRCLRNPRGTEASPTYWLSQLDFGYIFEAFQTAPIARCCPQLGLLGQPVNWSNYPRLPPFHVDFGDNKFFEFLRCFTSSALQLGFLPSLSFLQSFLLSGPITNTLSPDTFVLFVVMRG